MVSRLRLLAFAIFMAVFCSATTSIGLEKATARFIDSGRSDVWNRGASPCSVVYYNFCTGWVWIWSGWLANDQDQIGVCFDSCCDTPDLLSSCFLNIWTGTPSGYGFTGTIGVFDADANCCPTGTALATQSYAPLSGWNQFDWGIVVGSQFVIQVTHGLSALPNPTAYTSDHPEAGPTGPAACGTCYPTSRVNHSWYYGTVASPLCPGSALPDNLCDAQLLWDAQLGCSTAVQATSWASIKALYQ